MVVMRITGTLILDTQIRVANMSIAVAVIVHMLMMPVTVIQAVMIL